MNLGPKRPRFIPDPKIPRTIQAKCVISDALPHYSFGVTGCVRRYSLKHVVASNSGSCGLGFVALHHNSILALTLFQSLGCRLQSRHWNGAGARIDVCLNESRPQEAEIHSRSENPPDYTGEVRHIRCPSTLLFLRRDWMGAVLFLKTCYCFKFGLVWARICCTAS